MYKKIKNGSFMNWLWFIIALMPILLVFIYSSNFIFNKQTNGYKIDNLINLQKDFVEVTDEDLIYFENSNIYYYTYLSEQNYNSNYFIFNYSTSNTYSTNPFYLDFDNQNLDGLDYNVYIELVDLSNSNDLKLTYEIFYHNNAYSGDLSVGNILELKGTFSYGGDNFNIYLDNIPNEQWTYNFTLKIFVSFEPFSKELIKKQDSWFEVFVNNSFYDYLISVKSTIETNGFISNTFLNLSTFFGVKNVYYSLACYYVEYLLIIILLHLAFDILYILPNICHKFMERIGGERD